VNIFFIDDRYYKLCTQKMFSPYRMPKVESPKSPLPSIATKCCFTDSGFIPGRSGNSFVDQFEPDKLQDPGCSSEPKLHSSFLSLPANANLESLTTEANTRRPLPPLSTFYICHLYYTVAVFDVEEKGLEL
jgi:hypothetical protein